MEQHDQKRPSGYRISTAKDGDPTLLAEIDGKEYPLHSRISPAKEPSDPAPDPEKYDLLIVLGCGLGYGLLPLRDTISLYRQVVVIDILDGIENEIGQNMHSSFLADAANVKFITGMSADEAGSAVSEMITLNGLKGIHVREHNTSFRLFPSYYTAVKAELKRILDKKGSGAATIKAFGGIFLRNALFNLDNIEAMRPVGSLRGIFRGYRALIVSSAPSVEEYMKDIISNRERFVIIAVDSAVPMLEKQGIYPELAVSIDPQHRINEHLLGHTGDSTAHVFSIVSPPETVKKYGGFFSLNSHPVSQVIAGMYPGLESTIDSSSGSVAGDALSLALLCGFQSIAMTGFDFSFSHNRIYARGTAYQQRYTLMFGNRFRTAESFNAEYIFRSSRGFMEAGRYTRRSFVGYRDSLSAYIRDKCPGRIFWLSSGLVPDGALPAAMKDFLDAPAAHDESRAAADIINDAGSGGNPVDAARVKEFITRKDIWNELVRESLGTHTVERKNSLLRERIRATV